jgi:hypothetical protein
MIARIESNCTTGEVKYFDENEVEIDPSSISIEPIPAIEQLPVDEPLPADEPTPAEETNI